MCAQQGAWQMKDVKSKAQPIPVLLCDNCAPAFDDQRRSLCGFRNEDGVLVYDDFARKNMSALLDQLGLREPAVEKVAHFLGTCSRQHLFVEMA